MAFSEHILTLWLLHKSRLFVSELLTSSTPRSTPLTLRNLSQQTSQSSNNNPITLGSTELANFSLKDFLNIITVRNK